MTGISDTVRESAGILDESIQVLLEIESEHDDVLEEADLCDLYDMADDACESSRLRRAESALLFRQA